MRRTRTIVLALAFIVVACGGQHRANNWIPLATQAEYTPWSSTSSSGRLLTTKHYRIYTTAKSPTLLAFLPGFMEAAYQNYLRLTGLLDRQSEKRSTIYMMATREEWVLLTENVIKRNREMFLSIEAGGYFYEGVCVFWDMGGLGTFSVSAHEGLHQFLYHRLPNRLPMWLEEGLCVSTEGPDIDVDRSRVRFDPDRNAFRLNNLRSCILQNQWVSIAKLLPMDAGDVTTQGTERAVAYYGQLWALCRFIRSHPVYAHGLVSMIADAEAGRFHQVLDISAPALADLQQRGRVYNRAVSEPLFRHYIADDLSAFDREYLAFAKRAAGL